MRGGAGKRNQLKLDNSNGKLVSPAHTRLLAVLPPSNLPLSHLSANDLQKQLNSFCCLFFSWLPPISGPLSASLATLILKWICSLSKKEQPKSDLEIIKLWNLWFQLDFLSPYTSTLQKKVWLLGVDMFRKQKDSFALAVTFESF